MNPIKAIIIDDELQARNLLNVMIQEFGKDVIILETCADLPNGVKAIRKHQPDLIFLDIEMPGHSGLELLDFFDKDDIPFSIIFTTAYSEYAIKAFKLFAIDYLLKPIEPSDLENAIALYKKKTKSDREDLFNKVDQLKQSDVNKIGIPTQQGFKFIDVNTILYIKADNSYTELMTLQNEKIIISRTLKSFEEALAPFSNFQRTHKSYLVNTAYITAFVKSDGGYLVMQDKYQVPISPDKVDSTLKDKLFIKR
jgi:two-component system, LytTR family, response regulator